MDERSDQIVEHIEHQRQNLGRNLDELQNRIKQTADWRSQFDRHPMALMGVAMGGGLLLGALVKSGGGRSGRKWRSSSDVSSSRSFAAGSYGSSSSPSSSASYSGSSMGTGSGASSASSLMSLSSPGAQHQRNKAVEVFDNLKGGLLAYAASQAREWFNELLPGFSHHYDETARHNQSSSGQQHFSGSGSTGSGSSSQAGGYGAQTRGDSGQYGGSGFQRHAESGQTSSGSTPGGAQHGSSHENVSRTGSQSHEPTPAL